MAKLYRSEFEKNFSLIYARHLWRLLRRVWKFLQTGRLILIVEEPFWRRALDAGAPCLVTWTGTTRTSDHSAL